MKKIKLIGLVLVIGGLGLLFGRQVFAAEPTGFTVTNIYLIADKEVKDGDILANSTKGFVRSAFPYDNSIFGVLTDGSLVVFRDKNTPDARPIARSGVTLVNVTTTNGEIKVGDSITSSSIAGKGQKADKSGYVLGVAMGGFNGKAGEVGQVLVSIHIEYAELTTPRSANRLFEYLGASFLSNAKDPEKFGMIVRYVAAGLVLLISFGFGLWTFSKSLPKGIEAIGRNPLAKNTIYLSMGLNVGLIVLVGGLGIAGALLILRL